MILMVMMKRKTTCSKVTNEGRILPSRWNSCLEIATGPEYTNSLILPSKFKVGLKGTVIEERNTSINRLNFGSYLAF